MLVPLYGFLEGDTLGVLVLVHDHETIDDVANRLQAAAKVRVAPRSHVHVIAHGKRLDRSATVSAAGLTALDRVDVVAGDP